MCERKVEGEGLRKVAGHINGEVRMEKAASCAEVVQISTVKILNLNYVVLFPYLWRLSLVQWIHLITLLCHIFTSGGEVNLLR